MEISRLRVSLLGKPHWLVVPLIGGGDCPIELVSLLEGCHRLLHPLIRSKFSPTKKVKTMVCNK